MVCDIVFIHPDLGIGGAERLVVDAALALQGKGHSINIITSHHDTNHCFDETKNGTLNIHVYGDWIPRSIFGKFKALMAYIRMIYVALCFIFCSNFYPDIVFIDVISVIIPIVKWKCPRVLFYCHFPDQLLSQPGGGLKKLYRLPLDWMEEYTMKYATRVFVNSQFTKSVFEKTFETITLRPTVLYPSLPTDKFDQFQLTESHEKVETLNFLSINRYERKKNVALAIKAFNMLASKLSANEWDKCLLTIAGGYDSHNTENIEHFEELKQLVKEYNLADKVEMLKSPNDATKMSLIRQSLCLIYTPSHEHFGIVPLEAMYLSCPVLASNTGGPVETIADNETGFLRDPDDPEAFANVMAYLIKNQQVRVKMGSKGRQRVKKLFSFERFSEELHLAVCELTDS